MSHRKVRYRTEPMADVNITNLIDIVMVLLIVFILVSNFVTTGLNISVPKVRYVESTGKERIVIGIDTTGNFTINAAPSTEEEMPEQLKALKEQYPEEAIFIQADQLASYGSVAKIISLSREAGFSQVNLPMQPEPERK